ncbi:MAG: MATE family efflux transporter [Thermodesulfobacteriota bacterium]
MTDSDINSDITSWQIFLFWSPLALSWLMLSIEGSFVAAVIARLAEAKYNLAAHGVSFSLAMIFEAPIISITPATTALCSDNHSLRMLNRFTLVLNLMITALMLLMLISPVFSFFIQDLIGLPDKIADLTHTALIILLPWPMSIGFRRFYQGVLISRGLTRRITYGTIVRLSTMIITGLFLYFLNTTGAYAGAAALSMGVFVELIAVRLMAGSSISAFKQIKAGPKHNHRKLTYGYIIRFYYPLALMTVMSLGVYPMVIFFMGRSRFPIESLAVLPVVNSLIFIFRAIGFSYQEAIIALLNKNISYLRNIRSFAIGLGITLVVSLILVAFTPLSSLWFHSISGLSLHLTEFATLPVKIMAFMPGAAAMITFQWGILVHGGKTSPISIATVIEICTILASLFVLIGLVDMVGINAAAIAFMMGIVLGNLYLLPFTKRLMAKLT